jgi:glyoxylase-like metal-dependent hydrolase (beta-lactamase superfamily II)/8-oxo-dGTP pyrophosphatase MutT (NUDIX family)
MDLPAPKIAVARPASSVVLTRRTERGLEVFWVRRGQQLKFAGGFFAFAGGRVDAADALLPMDGAEGLDGEERACLAAALRELFEETGVLAVPGAERVPEAERRAVRLELTAREGKKAKAPPPGEPLFSKLLSAHGLRADARVLLPAGRWITPPSVPTRFDTRFYLVALPANEAAEVWPGELADGEWITPGAALARWDDGTALLHPPAWHTLKCLAERAAAAGDAHAALPMLQDPSRAPWSAMLPIKDFVVQRMEFQRGVLIFPLRTPTLPPATHTNTLLLGDDRLAVVDPGSPWEEEQALLENELHRLAALGRRAVEIVLTHYHHDHVAGAMPLSARLGLPIAAHQATADRLRGEVRIDRIIADDEPLPYGPRGWRALHLPGHTLGHLCFLEQGSGAVVAGDLVAGGSTVVIDPPEGDMADYLRSLDRLLALSPRTLYPAHGQVVPAGAELLNGYVAHRMEREAKVAAALLAHAPRGPALPAELVPAAYAEISPELYPLAERSLLAHLLKLVKDGRASEAGGRFSAR